MSTTHAERPLRRDAERNRALILEGAERVFAAKGLDASVDDIAAEVGVGVGTIYRRFGSKQQLIEALFRQRVDDNLAVIDEVARHPSAWDALCEIMRRFVADQAQNRAVKELFYEIADPGARMLRERVEPVLTELVERAKREGSLRADFAATDIPLLTYSISTIAYAMPEGGAALAGRHLELLLKGLAPTPDEASIPAPLADDDFALWMRSLAR